MTKQKSQPRQLEQEYNYYLKNRRQLAKKYGGKYIVIRAEEVVGAYETQSEALEAALKKYKMGTFMLRQANKPVVPIIFHRVTVNGA